MRILIMAGGKGTRLYPLTKYHPKVLTSVHGKPFLYYILKLYEKHDIVLSIGHMGDVVKKWCKENNALVEFAEEDEELGHAGAIANAQAFLEDKNMFAVVNGDTWHNISLNSVCKGFLRQKEYVAMRVFATNKLTGQLGGSGIYIFKPECFRYFRKGMHTDDILPCIHTAKVCLQDKYYLDIGTHDGLRLAKQSTLIKGDA